MLEGTTLPFDFLPVEYAGVEIGVAAASWQELPGA
jgi:hypothetical protein